MRWVGAVGVVSACVLVAWIFLRRLGSDIDIQTLATVSQEIGLTDVLPLASKLLNGEVTGRVVVDVNC